MIELCDCCRLNLASQIHHKFSQGTRKGWRRKLYGKLIDDPKNLMRVCADCNASHRNPNLIIWTEKQFIEALDIKAKSKVGILIEKRSLVK